MTEMTVHYFRNKFSRKYLLKGALLQQIFAKILSHLQPLDYQQDTGWTSKWV